MRTLPPLRLLLSIPPFRGTMPLPLLAAALTLAASTMALAAAAETAPVSGASIERSGPGFAVTANYPVLAGPEPGIARANREIRAFVEALVESFVADRAASQAELAEPAADEAAAEFEMPPWSLEIDHAPPHRTERYVAIAFNGYDYRGGAHGMPVIAPLVIDLASGEPVPPAGLFRPGSDWVGILASACLRELSQRDPLAEEDEEWLRNGTAPQPENYQLLYPGPEGLTVTFPPYAVAPYAAGPQEVTVPYRLLREVLAPALFGPGG